MPPGPPTQWLIGTIDMTDGGKSVDVGMWTKQEGRSDLTLELELHEVGPDQWKATIHDLHVL